MSNFFNEYINFVKNVDMTHNTNRVIVNEENNLIRMNLRHELFFKHWEYIWKDATVLDIAGYDGRWSFAALKAKAKHTTIVEIRKSVIDKGIKTFQEYNIPNNSYEFINEDFLTWKPKKKYNVVFCAGFLSHTYNHPKVFSIIRECNPDYLIIDTSINMLNGIFVVPTKDQDREGDSHITDTSFVFNDGLDIIQNWAGSPSKAFVLELISTYDFTLIEEFDWLKLINQDCTKSVEDYWIGMRASFLAKRNEGWRWDRKLFNK